MPTSSIADILAPASFCQLTDTEGRLILVPAATAGFLRAAGHHTYTFTLILSDHPETDPGWLTVTAAAKRHLDDIDGITLAAAKVKISRAARSKVFVSTGEGHRRRIDPVSFDGWRLTEREKNLDRHDREL